MEVVQLQVALQEKEAEVENLTKENQRLRGEISELKKELNLAKTMGAAKAGEKLGQFGKPLELAEMLSSRDAQEGERRVQKVMEAGRDGDGLNSESASSENNIEESPLEDQHGRGNPHLTWGTLDQHSQAKVVKTLKRHFEDGSNYESLCCFLEGPNLSELIIGNMPTKTDLYRSVVKSALTKYHKVNWKRETALSESQFSEVHAQLGIDQHFPWFSTDLAPYFNETPIPRQEISKIGLVQIKRTVRKEEMKFINEHLAAYFSAKWIVDTLSNGKWNKEVSKLLHAALGTTSMCCQFKDDYKYYNGLEDWELRKKGCECTCHAIDEQLSPSHWEFSELEFCSILDYLLGEEDIETFPSVRIEFTHRSSISAESEALAHHNFHNILNLLCQMGTHEGRALSNMLFSEKTTHIAMLMAGVEYFRLANPTIKDRDWMDNTLRTEALRKAVHRRYHQLLEFFLDEMGMVQLVENSTEEFLNLVNLCVGDTKDINDELLEQQVKLLHRLYQIHPSLLKEWLVNEHGNEVTHLVCHEIHFTLLIELIKLGADDINDTFDFGGQKETVLRKSASLPPSNFESLLMCVGEEKLRGLENAKDNSSYTIFHSAIKSGNPSTETINLLVNAGYDVNAVDKHEYSVLATAVKVGCSASVVSQLIGLGANVGWKRKKGESLLHLTAVGNRGNEDVVNLLLKEKTIEKNGKDDDGLTALDYAINSQWRSAVKVREALHKAGVKSKNAIEEEDTENE